jgi:6,7-dimethyl-8-ribityllumazine synthase
MSTEHQASKELERTKLGGATIENKGGEAAVAAMEMISVLKKLDARLGG